MPAPVVLHTMGQVADATPAPVGPEILVQAAQLTTALVVLLTMGQVGRPTTDPAAPATPVQVGRLMMVLEAPAILVRAAQAKAVLIFAVRCGLGLHPHVTTDHHSQSSWAYAQRTMVGALNRKRADSSPTMGQRKDSCGNGQ